MALEAEKIRLRDNVPGNTLEETMYNILTLNNISEEGIRRRLPADKYAVADDAVDPAGILVRSFKMHDMELGASLEGGRPCRCRRQ